MSQGLRRSLLRALRLASSKTRRRPSRAALRPCPVGSARFGSPPRRLVGGLRVLRQAWRCTQRREQRNGALAQARARVWASARVGSAALPACSLRRPAPVRSCARARSALRRRLRSGLATPSAPVLAPPCCSRPVGGRARSAPNRLRICQTLRLLSVLSGRASFCPRSSQSSFPSFRPCGLARCRAILPLPVCSRRPAVPPRCRRRSLVPRFRRRHRGGPA